MANAGPSPLQCRVISGAIVALRLYDVAFSIDLARVESIWRELMRPASIRSRLSMTPAKAITFDVPPVILPLPAMRLRLGQAEPEVAVCARCYDFGVIALAVRVPVRDCAWTGFVALMSEVDKAIGPQGTAPPWAPLLATLRTELGSALERPSGSALEEDYLLGIVRQWDQPMTAAAVLDTLDLVPVLSGEHRALSEDSRRELLSQRFSYYEDDLVVLTWDRAFIYEPRTDTDVADVLEVANAQLLEQRYYDKLLDDELPRMYDLVEATRRVVNWLAPRRFSTLARRLHVLVAEVTELTEKVDNVLQVAEDVYLARVYAAALQTLRVPAIGAAVDRKLAIIRDTYSALYSEATSSRGELMELTIILLIVLEIVLALLR